MPRVALATSNLPQAQQILEKGKAVFSRQKLTWSLHNRLPFSSAAKSSCQCRVHACSCKSVFAAANVHFAATNCCSSEPRIEAATADGVVNQIYIYISVVVFCCCFSFLFFFSSTDDWTTSGHSSHIISLFRRIPADNEMYYSGTPAKSLVLIIPQKRLLQQKHCRQTIRFAAAVVVVVKRSNAPTNEY